MAPILVVARGLPSVVYPAVELARRLRAQGHPVVFAGGLESRALAEHVGLRFLGLSEMGLKAFAERDAGGWAERVRRLPERREAAAAALNLSAFLDVLHRDRPSLVLLNAEMHEEIVATLAGGVPLALLNTFVATWRGATRRRCSGRWRRSEGPDPARRAPGNLVRRVQSPL